MEKIMNEKTTALIREYGPLLGFLLTYFFAPEEGTGLMRPIMLGTMVFTILTIATLIWTFAIGQKPKPITLLIAALVIPIGLLSLLLNDEAIFKMKPTIVNLVLAVLVAGSQWQGRPLIKEIVGNSLELEKRGWELLSWRWAMFFVASAIANEIAWRNLSDDGWVTFKFAVLVPAAFVFALSQIGLLKRYATAESSIQKDR